MASDRPKHRPPKRKPGDGRGKLRTYAGEVMDVRTVSSFCGWSENITRAKIARGTIPHSKLDGRIIVLRSRLLKWLADLPGISVEEARANAEERRTG